jgi:hypothetical protein
MADDEPTPDPRRERPILTGLVALMGVAVVVGLILGGGALAATKLLGIGNDDTASDDSTSGDSLYLPPPEKTTAPSGPLVTLASPDQTETSEAPEKSESKEPETEISLSAGQTEVSPMEQIDLTGVFPGGEGAILQVQRFEGGKWEDFPVTASVSNETFSTYIQTSQAGVNRFRVVDTDSRKASNEVRVKIS